MAEIIGTKLTQPNVLHEDLIIENLTNFGNKIPYSSNKITPLKQKPQHSPRVLSFLSLLLYADAAHQDIFPAQRVLY